MYFCVSAPNEYGIPGSHKCVKSATSPSGRVLAVLTPVSVQIWSVNDYPVFLMEISTISHGGGSEEVCVDMSWSPSGENIAVVTSMNTLVLLQVDIKYLDATVEVADNLRRPLASGRVVVYGSTKIRTVLTSMVTTLRHVLLCAQSGHVFVVGWGAADVLQVLSPEIFQQQNAAGRNEAPAIDTAAPVTVTYVTYHVAMGLLGIINNNDRITLMNVNTTTSGSMQNPTVHVPPPLVDFRFSSIRRIPNAHHVVFNKRHYRAAVACGADTFVHMYPLHGEGQTRSLGSEPIRAWMQQSWSNDLPFDIGEIQCMAWSPDEEMLVVGYKHCGFAMFHFSGVCLMCSFPRFRGSMTHALRGLEIMAQGCTSLSFDREGAHLLSSFHGDTTFLRTPLGKRPLGVHAGPPVFFTSTVVYLLPRGSEGWEIIPVPAEYLQANHPIRYVSVSVDGSQLVVCGLRGFAVYSVERRKWTMISAVQHEASLIAVCPPCWVDNAAVAFANKNVSHKRHELLFYPRNHLDRSAQFYELILQRKPFSVECTRCSHRLGYFMVGMLCTDNTYMIYDLQLHSDDRIKVKKLSIEMNHLYTIALDGQYASPLGVYLVSLATSTSPLLIFHARDGTVRSLDPCAATYELLSSNPVDMLWVDDTWHTLDVSVTTTSHVFFSIVMYDSKAGTSVLTVVRDVLPTPLRNGRNEATSRRANDFAQRPGSTTTLCEVVTFDPDNMPMGLWRSEGVIVFGMEAVKPNPFPHVAYPEYDVRLKPVLYMHAVIYALFAGPYLHESDDLSRLTFTKETTARLVYVFQSKSTFTDCMDWLLHYALNTGELRSRARATDQRKLLRSIIATLQGYKEFYAILANCLRKTDYALSGALLEVIGSPVDLFNECISRNRIEEAAYLLRTIQTNPTDNNSMQGLETACTGARRLFPTVVARHNFLLAFELLRFIALLTCEMDLSAADTPSPAVTPMSALEKVLRNVLGGGSSPTISTTASTSAPTPRPRSDSIVRSDSFRRETANEGLRFAGPAGSLTIVHTLLAKDKSLRTVLEHHAVQMLACGRLAQLCTLLDTFSFDLSHFLSSRWREVSSSMDIREAFDNIHKEFSLPRGSHEVKANNTQSGTSPTSSFSAPHPPDVCTPTQVRMSIISPIKAAFLRLRQVFMSHGCAEYVLLLSTILMCVADVQELLREHTDLVPDYIAMLSDPCNAGYGRMIYECGLAKTSPTCSYTK
eukprot:PhF_6_TR36328/c0_g1_i1/m.53180/K20476/RIC1; RAB6A-GEF complex partner protein 1